MLKDLDYGTLSMEGIAAHAGVGKQTLYPWRPRKGALIMDAVLRIAAEIPDPDTGDVKRDLLIYFTASVEASRRSAPALRGLMVEAQLDASFSEHFRKHFIEVRRRTLLKLLERARKSGQLRKGIVPERTADLVFGALWYRVLVRNGPLDRPFAQSMIDHLDL